MAWHGTTVGVGTTYSRKTEWKRVAFHLHRHENIITFKMLSFVIFYFYGHNFFRCSTSSSRFFFTAWPTAATPETSTHTMKKKKENNRILWLKGRKDGCGKVKCVYDPN